VGQAHTLFGTAHFTLTEKYDTLGRSQGYALSNTVSGITMMNQYTDILCASAPLRENILLYDLDGNQTLLHTTTGLWHVDYNAENRPVLFSNETAIITMAYDHQGRRTEMKVVQSGTTTRHERYLYRGYLQIAALDLLDATNVNHAITWDPTEPTATQPLALQRGTNGWSYGFDQVKNVTELFDATGALAATYDYAPFGALTDSTGPAADLNPLTFSSEIHDAPLGLIYYNVSHLNVLDGRWVSRDPIEERGGINVFVFVGNRPSHRVDMLGQLTWTWPWIKCCGVVQYNWFTECCCNGQVFSESEIDSGVRRWGRYFGTTMGYHEWITFDGRLADVNFALSPSFAFQTGTRVMMGENPFLKWDGMMSPCKYNIKCFKECLHTEAILHLGLPFPTYANPCVTYADHLLNTCKSKCLGCGNP
jgi:RHS repeat-associated protein